MKTENEGEKEKREGCQGGGGVKKAEETPAMTAVTREQHAKP